MAIRSVYGDDRLDRLSGLLDRCTAREAGALAEADQAEARRGRVVLPESAWVRLRMTRERAARLSRAWLARYVEVRS